ncbi:hypothetical protein PFLUV_G00072310 [Perca fluviatilis]|uniref:Uncharacterized protein n=1 Tax=Perca fluviatilis TaxID=8168 RepID=A0A6A5F723_PERFL|nr:hypothetical protein PFLUV_G00072310 [Perca fluviatilis]
MVGVHTIMQVIRGTIHSPYPVELSAHHTTRAPSLSVTCSGRKRKEERAIKGKINNGGDCLPEEASSSAALIWRDRKRQNKMETCQVISSRCDRRTVVDFSRLRV